MSPAQLSLQLQTQSCHPAHLVGVSGIAQGSQLFRALKMSVLTDVEDARGIFKVPEIMLLSSLPLEGFFLGGVLWVCGIPHCFSLCLCSQGQADEQDHSGKHHVCLMPSPNAFP